MKDLADVHVLTLLGFIRDINQKVRNKIIKPGSMGPGWTCLMAAAGLAAKSSFQRSSQSLRWKMPKDK